MLSQVPIKQFSQEHRDLLNEQIKVDEVRKAITTVQNNTSPGIDAFNVNFCKNTHINIHTYSIMKREEYSRVLEDFMHCANP